MEKSEKSIILDTPIKRGENEVTEITINKPNSGALRGASLRGLLEFQTDDILKVLPRVSEPPLTAVEVAAMDPADLIQAGALIADFLLSKRVKESATKAYLPA